MKKVDVHREFALEMVNNTYFTNKIIMEKGKSCNIFFSTGICWRMVTYQLLTNGLQVGIAVKNQLSRTPIEWCCS